MATNPSYCLGFVSGPLVHVRWLFSLMQCPVKVIGVQSGPMLSNSRNEVVERFLRDFSEDYLLMTDTDITWTRQDLDYLLAHDDPDIVSGLYAADNGLLMAGRWSGTDGLMKTLQEAPESPERVDSVGAGFMLVHRRVFEKIGGGWFDYEKGPTGTQLGEDVAFCHKVRGAGFTILLDPRIRLGHMKVIEITPDSVLYRPELSP